MGGWGPPLSFHLPSRGEIGERSEPGGGLPLAIPPRGAFLAPLKMLRPPRVGGGERICCAWVPFPRTARDRAVLAGDNNLVLNSHPNPHRYGCCIYDTQN